MGCNMENTNESEILKKHNKKLLLRIADLESANAHLESQLSMASKLKYHLMPNSYPAFPDVPDIDIFADSIEIKQIGGDYYDFFRIDADHIGIVIADIFDGGSAAALYMVAFKTYLTSQISLDNEVAQRVETANDLLCWENADDLCLSAWFGVYEISSGILKCVNAGHEKSIILRDSKAYNCEMETVSYLLGVASGMKYDSFEIKLEAGDKLLLYTDGVTGAAIGDEGTYGRDRLVNAYESTGDMGAEETVAYLEKDFSKYTRDMGIKEDVTFLCVKRQGGERL